MGQIFLILCLAAFFLFAISSCHEQPKDNGQTYNHEYVVASIPRTDNFFELSKNEEALDSISNNYDKYMDSLTSANPKYKDVYRERKRDFRKNRARIFMSYYSNGNYYPGDSVISSPCSCIIHQDTLFISMVIGFFGGIGFEIKLFDKDFESAFFTYTDDVKPYKTDLSDTAFDSQASVKNKFQFLILDKKPTFKTGQGMTGYLTYTSKNFYEKSIGNSLDTVYVKGKLYFTCNTKKDIGPIKWSLN